jgi:uncharacterized protein
MSPDLQRLARLHQLELDIDVRRQTIAALPDRLRECDARVSAAESALASARGHGAANLATRRALEKDLAVVQARLSKYKDQLMEVKTNREYVAMQHEIAAAQSEVGALEDRLLELMVTSDELSATIKAAEMHLVEETRKADEERRARTAETARLEDEVRALTRETEAVEREVSAQAIALYRRVAERRRGSVMAAVRDGHCSACNVRLRPSRLQEVLRGDELIQCDSCSRILYSIPAPVLAKDSPAS